MSHATIRHDCSVAIVSVVTSVSSSTTVSLAGMAGSVVFVAGSTSSATLTIFGSSDGVSFSPLYNATGTPATLALPTNGGAVAMPDAAFGTRFVRLVSDAELGTAASVSVSLKS